jgi:pimeloyl-ACP methyl ester carboxylesterase
MWRVVGVVDYGARMTNFVLVPGAWLGAWAWDEVAEPLTRDGYDVVAVTLSGLADRRGDDAALVGQARHVDDIVSAVEDRDLREVVLVGHSYSGVPVGQAAARIGDRLRRVVYVDSNVATDGQSFIGSLSPEGQAEVTRLIADNGGLWPQPQAADYAGQDLSDEAIALIVERSTPHPSLALSEPVELVRPIAELPSTYIKCLMNGDQPSDDVKALLESPNWELVELDTGHWPMFSRPVELAKVLGELG